MKHNETMVYLAERVRMLVGDHPGIAEKYMFGTLSFLLNGWMVAGCTKDGEILVSVGKDHAQAAAARPGARPLLQKGREVTGFFWVEADAIEDDDDLRGWIDFAFRAASQRPPKKDKALAKKAPAKKALKKKI
jgi:TfoX/Sxy family transcriptional regulator of competence genes